MYGQGDSIFVFSLKRDTEASTSNTNCKRKLVGYFKKQQQNMKPISHFKIKSVASHSGLSIEHTRL